jgi:hypothetical protein
MDTIENVLLIDPSSVIRCFRYEIRYRIAKACFPNWESIKIDEDNDVTGLFPFTANETFFVRIPLETMAKIEPYKDSTVLCAYSEEPNNSEVEGIIFANGRRSEIIKLDYSSLEFHSQGNPYLDTRESWNAKAAKTRVYKYRQLYYYDEQKNPTKNPHTEMAIKSGTLYTPRPVELNDPFDASFVMNSILRSLSIDGGTLEALRNRFGIFSVSKKNDDILMWSHYGDSHQGICLGYGVKDLLDGLAASYAGTIFAGPVIYSSDRPRMDYFSWLMPFAKQRFLLETYLMTCLFTKFREWSYEQEYRFVRFPRDPLAPIQQTFTSLPSEFYFGCHASASNAVKDFSINGPYRVFIENPRFYSLDLI